jgi:hypothetical protein
VHGEVRLTGEDRFVDLFGKEATISNAGEWHVENAVARRTDYMNLDLHGGVGGTDCLLDGARLPERELTAPRRDAERAIHH